MSDFLKQNRCFFSVCYHSNTGDIFMCISYYFVSEELVLTEIFVFYDKMCWLVDWCMVFNATSNNISVILWRSVLLVEETGVPGENHRPVSRHWQTLLQSCIEYISPWTGFERTTLVVIGTDCTGSFKSNYHTITTTTTSKKSSTLLGAALLLLVAKGTYHSLSFRVPKKCWFATTRLTCLIKVSSTQIHGNYQAKKLQLK